MPSRSLNVWLIKRLDALDEIENAHAEVGGINPGRRFTTQQINQAYVVLLSSQFQGYCKDIHTECIGHLTGAVPSIPLRTVLGTGFAANRKLDFGNPNDDNLGKDFGRFGFKFWDAVKAHSVRNNVRKKKLGELNTWRNAIAHQSLDNPNLGRSTVLLSTVRGWRRACEGLAVSIDSVMRVHLQGLLGNPPW